jgi:hypothetical protein
MPHSLPSYGKYDVLETVIRQNIRSSSVILSDIQDFDHLPVFQILDHVKTKHRWEPVEKFRLGTVSKSPRIEVNSEEEADKAARNFTASLASAFRLSSCKVTLLDMKNHDLPGFHLMIKHEKTLRNL